jgi:iron complex transport system permease protein
MTTTSVPSGVGDRVLVTRRGRLALRFHPRTLVVCAILLVATLIVGLLALSTGPTHVPLGDVLPALLHIGRPGDVFVVEYVRLPRLLLGVLVGAALGAGGGLFQSLARNPLGSPDIIGFDTGAATGAIVAILGLGATSAFAIAGASLIGGLITAMIVLALSAAGGVQVFRLILVGIGAAAVLSALNTFLLEFASVADAEHVALWLTGTLTGATWPQTVPVALALLVLLPTAGVAARGLRVLEMGDPAATSLGVRVRSVRLLTIATGIGLTATATSVAGPIGFVALAAPQLARRLTRADGPNIAGSAAMGGFLLTLSDFIAGRILPGQELPVGVVTGALGGLYLAWLLVHEWRRNRT